MKVRIVFKPHPGANGNVLAFVDVTDEDGNPLGEVASQAMEWLADGDHEALQIDCDLLPRLIPASVN